MSRRKTIHRSWQRRYVRWMPGRAVRRRLGLREEGRQGLERSGAEINPTSGRGLEFLRCGRFGEAVCANSKSERCLTTGSTFREVATPEEKHEREITVTFKDGRLFAAPGAQQPLGLLAVDSTTFRPIYFDDYGVLSFNVEDGKTLGCVLKHGAEETHLSRA